LDIYQTPIILSSQQCNDNRPSSTSDTFRASDSLSDLTFIFRAGFRLALAVFLRLDVAVHYKVAFHSTLHLKSRLTLMPYFACDVAQSL